MKDAGKEESTDVGKKTVAIGKLIQAGIPFLQGFVVSPFAFKTFLEQNNLIQKLSHLQNAKSKTSIESEIKKATLPEDFAQSLLHAYSSMGGQTKTISLNVEVTLPENFSKTYHVEGEANLILTLKNILLDIIKQNHSFPQSIAVIVTKQEKAQKKGTFVTSDTVEAEKIQAASLAKTIEKQLYFPQVISWILCNNKLLITNIKQADEERKNIAVPRIPVGTHHTATKVFVNMLDTEHIEEIAKQHTDGVGILRYEDLMKTHVHPKTYIQEKKQREFIDELVSKITRVAKAFSPRPVIYQTSDLTTREYRFLQNGDLFETKEQNPNLGYRGTYRYLHDQELFSLELEAIKKVRNVENLKNVWLLLPFVRSVEELIKVKQLIASHNLYRSASFKILMVVEIPSQVILLDKFLDVGIDGVVIDPDDITTLLTGIDNKNTDMHSEFAEEHPAVLWAYQHILSICHNYSVFSSFCTFKEPMHTSLLEKMIGWGIQAISVAPKNIESTREDIARIEKVLYGKD